MTWIFTDAPLQCNLNAKAGGNAFQYQDHTTKFEHYDCVQFCKSSNN